MIGFSVLSQASTAIKIPDKDGDDFTGYAYDLKTKSLLYTEHHKYLDEMTHIVQYKEVNGDLFASKLVNYQYSFYSPNIIQSNRRNGELIDIRINNGRKEISISYQENEREEAKRGLIDFTPSLIVDTGFDQYITKNWDILINDDGSGKELTIDYLIPSALDHYKLSIKQEDCKINDHYCFSISAPNFFINLFSNDLKLTYSKLDGKSPKLISFQGRSNICDSEGDYQDVKIIYQYE
jgi:hypothetical protein